MLYDVVDLFVMRKRVVIFLALPYMGKRLSIRELQRTLEDTDILWIVWFAKKDSYMYHG